MIRYRRVVGNLEFQPLKQPKAEAEPKIVTYDPMRGTQKSSGNLCNSTDSNFFELYRVGYITVTLIIGTSQVCVCHTMSMGAYDEEEHERRERKNSEVDASFDDQRNEYEGRIEYKGGESTEELLDQFKQIQSK